jgi:hypothetical protein
VKSTEAYLLVKSFLSMFPICTGGAIISPPNELNLWERGLPILGQVLVERSEISLISRT